MTQTTIHTRQGLPPEMQLLLRDYPRDAWPDHPDFAESIRNWMGAHHMFRQLAGITQKDTEKMMDRTIDPAHYADRLAHFGTLLVRNLHGHHGWEDHSFFPELNAADPRFERGLDMLEGDHVELDDVLDRFTRQGNRIVQLHQLDPDQIPEQAKLLHGLTKEIGLFLTRHLRDEEDLVVPILLHHQLRG
ncbi:hemerythrin domain-containing protein [Shimia sp.]|uniref:hemerythrin domain-containing protein n=1 Tax=Shimia sp. TaxID=1954381 RepID=UPI0032977A96